MKKNRMICLFLSLLMLITTLTACNDNDDESAVSGENSDVSEDTTDYALVKAAIDAKYTDDIDRGLARKNIAAGKSYNVSYEAHNDYPDAGKKLTDGTFAKDFYNGSDKAPWAGFNANANGNLEIELDLSAEYNGIADIGINFSNNLTFGIGIPTNVEFYAAGNDGEYVLIGKITSPKKISDKSLYDTTLKLQKGITASKIKLKCLGAKSAWLFIDEIFVYKYEGEASMENNPTNYYGEVKIPEITEPTYWSKSDADYNKTINLLEGLSQQIVTYAPIDANLAMAQKNTPASGIQLTNGQFETNATYSANGWFRFTRGLGRSVIYDLGNTSAVKGYSFGFLKEKSSGVGLPSSVTVSASEDGVGWKDIHIADKIYSEKDSEIVRVSGDFDTAYRARYIKITFMINAHVYADEFQIMGTKNAANAKAIVPDEAKEQTFPNKFAAPEDFNNINDVLLTYIGNPDAEAISKDTFLPHVAYVQDGEIKDTLFDTYMFLPYVAFLYENGKKKPLKKEDWQKYIDIQFEKNSNMDALEAAVAETKSALNLPDYKAGVFLSIFYPVTSQTAFGEINGKNLDFSNIEDRKIAVKWFIDEQLRMFKEKGYENLYIEGFYWFTEEISYDDKGLLDLIKYSTDYVRSLEYITTWIPYYQASGYNEWSKLGFDLACYQPNFAFNKSVPDQRLFDAAEAAKLLGMCIELEIGGSSAEDVDRLKKYFAVGAQTGYMTDAIHMYYQGGVPGSIYNSYKSGDEYLHSLYDDLYKFIKGEFTFETAAPTDQSFECEVSKNVTGELPVESKNVLKGYTIITSPKYGTVQFNKDGSFVYTPFKGITGEDYFEVAADFGYDISESAKISISIK